MDLLLPTQASPTLRRKRLYQFLNASELTGIPSEFKGNSSSMEWVLQYWKENKVLVQKGYKLGFSYVIEDEQTQGVADDL